MCFWILSFWGGVDIFHVQIDDLVDICIRKWYWCWYPNRYSVQFSSLVMSNPATPGTAVFQASLSITNSWDLLKLISINSVMPSNHLIICHPLLLLPSVFPSIRVFPNESVLRIRWPRVLGFSFKIIPSNEYSGLISFRVYWFDLLVVQGTPKSVLQHCSSKASVLWCSAFFVVQLSHPYMTTGKTSALTRRTFVSKVMPLFFNMLSRFIVAFFSEEQAYFNFMAVVTICSNFGTRENTIYHCAHCLPIYSPWSDGIGCHDLSFLNVQGFLFVCFQSC